MIDEIIQCFLVCDKERAKSMIQKNVITEEVKYGTITVDKIGIGEYIYNLVKDNKILSKNGKDIIPDLLRFLNDCGYSYQYESDNGNNILTCAVYHGNHNVIDAFIETVNNTAYLYSGCSNPFYDEDREDEWSSPIRYAIDKKDNISLRKILNKLDEINDSYYDKDMIQLVDSSKITEDVENDLSDVYFSSFSYAVYAGDLESVKLILEKNKNNITYDDKRILYYLDWNTLKDGKEKLKYIQNNTDFKYNVASAPLLIKNINNKVDETSSEKLFTIDDIKMQIKKYTSKVLSPKMLDIIASQNINFDMIDSLDFLIKSAYLIINAEYNQENNILYSKELTDVQSNLYSTVYSAYQINKDINLIKENVLPFYKDCFTCLLINDEIDFKKDVLDEFINILENMESIITLSDVSKSTFIKEIRDILYSINVDEFKQTLNNEEIEMLDDSNSFIKEKGINQNYKPLKILETGYTVTRQEYINAPDAFDAFIGVDIQNPNKNFCVESVGITISFYLDGMVIDKVDDKIIFIDCDKIFHYGIRCRVSEPFDNYTVRINGGDYEEVEKALNVEQYVNVSNLRYKINPYDRETKVSCQILNNIPQDLSFVELYVQLKLCNKIVAGFELYQSNVCSGGTYDMLTTEDLAPDCDEIVYSIVPRI